MAAATLAAPPRPGSGQRASHPGRPVGVRVAVRDRRAARGAQPRAQRRVVAQATQRRAERGAVAGGNNKAGLLVADELTQRGTKHKNPRRDSLTWALGGLAVVIAFAVVTSLILLK